jgi:hypothetical protein
MSSQQPSTGTEAIKEFDETLFVDTTESSWIHPADSTCRPNRKPEATQGTKFEPFNLHENRDPVAHDLPSTPLLLFQHFIPIFLVQKWALYTNQHVNSLLQDPALPPSARIRQWQPTSVEEIYLWLGILIYIGIHREIRIKDHWEVPNTNTQGPIHSILTFMTYDRFWLIFRYIRTFDPTTFNNHNTTYNRTWGRIDEWSDHIQKASTELLHLGINCAIDEVMICYKGRSKGTTIVQGKPIPRGFKVWAVAQKGVLLRWIWHLPEHPWGLLAAHKSRKANRGLNPTQAVVVMLMKALPNATYHVFCDNLFSTGRLFIILREDGYGATGTARVNSGIYKPYVTAKKDDKARGASGFKFNEIRTAPTPDNQVSLFLTLLPALHILICLF